MNIEFHYYIMYILTQKAGFSNQDSYIIACSSQYVDNNTMRVVINKGQEDEYKNYISQTMDILKPKEKLMRIYPCFHFIPGDYDCDSAKRKDGKLHVLNTTPNSKNSIFLMDEALKTKNLYRIGICAHSYADSWAHQNFVGYIDYVNGLGGVRRGILEKLTPNIGHADAQNQPDIPGLVWEDGRLIKEIREVHNTERFLEAAEFIFKRFRKYLKPKEKASITQKDWSRLKGDLENAISDEYKGEDKNKNTRISNYKKLISNFKEYDKNEWFDNAVETKIKGLKDIRDWGPLNRVNIFPDKYNKRNGFGDSPWYKFQEAIKDHQRVANKLYAKLYHQLEVEEY